MTENKIFISDEMIEILRERVKPYLSEKRYQHTLAVEEEAAALGKIFIPDDYELENRLRAAALLHDITKNYTVQKQLKCCEEFGIIIGEYDVDMPKVFHAKTAAAVAERDFADFVDDDIINAIRWHTTGHAKMSLFECIIYLADYIEPTRDFPDCIELREFFYQKVKICTTESERLMLLCDTMVLSIDMTIKNLIAESSLIDRDTVEARNFFINI